MKVIKSRPQIKKNRSSSSSNLIKSLKDRSGSMAVQSSIKQVKPTKDRQFLKYQQLIINEKKRVLQYRTFDLRPFQKCSNFKYAEHILSKYLIDQLREWNQFTLIKIAELNNQQIHQIYDLQDFMGSQTYLHYPENWQWQKNLEIYKLQHFFTAIYNLLKSTINLPPFQKEQQVIKVHELFQKWIKPEEKESQEKNSQVEESLSTFLTISKHTQKQLKLFGRKNRHQRLSTQNFRFFSSHTLETLPAEKTRQKIKSLCTASTQKLKSIIESTQKQIKEEERKLNFALNKRKSLLTNQRVRQKLIIGRPQVQKTPQCSKQNILETKQKKVVSQDKDLLDIIGIDLIDQTKLIVRPKNKIVKFQKGSLKFNTKKNKKSSTKLDIKTQKSIRSIFQEINN